MRRWAFAGLLVLTAVAVALPASADDLRVLVVGRAGDTAKRIRDELRLLGFRVEMLETEDEVDWVKLARVRDAVAAMDVRPGGDVVIWVDPESARLPELSGRMRVEPDAGADPRMVALRAVEMVRGRLVELPPEAEERKPSPSRPEPAEESAPVSAEELLAAVLRRPRSELLPPPAATPDAHGGRRARRWRASLAPAVAFGAGGVPATAQLRAGGSFHPWWRLGVELHASAPLTEASVDGERGGLSLRLLTFGGSLLLRATDSGAPFEVEPGIGVDAVALFYEGRAQAPLVARRGVSWSAMPHVTVGLVYRLWPWLALRADPQLGIFLPEQVPRVVGEPVARMGRPFAQVSLGVEVRP